MKDPYSLLCSYLPPSFLFQHEMVIKSNFERKTPITLEHGARSCPV